ncbi:hypothetical protein C8N40_108158 [Pontibacter mucosus]|uniref:TraB family protein n=1 Tax=Pontibacter mucosus TaxID=1649266 RepID=A0A2T5YEW4_9BACT|nr:TraB/GumN family protein [Pontibacter mucosus]PTX15266.1 hypothetical protein C8N40_108158 [Pontibacter mucosus]
MNRRLHLLLALLLVLTQLMPALANGGKEENALLWKITGKGLKKPSYLYGTIHAVCPDKMVISETLQKALGQTEQLSLELDMDDPDMMSQFMMLSTLPEGQSLKAMFTKEEYEAVGALFKSTYGADLQFVDNLKPFVLYSMLIPVLTECTPESYEQKLMNLAHSQQKEVLGIESVQEQMAVVDELPNKFYVDMVTRTATNLAKSRAEYSEMVDLYFAQDLKGLQELMQRDYPEEDYRKFNEAFLVKRNRNWIPVMERMAKAKPTFFAVGAAHLSGEEGVVALLRKQGYKVEPVQK